MINALIRELKLRKDEFQNDRVKTIYFGGGTPSLLTISELLVLIDAIYDNYKVIENPEITLEANPDDLSAKQIVDLADTSINRLSIGIQSFFDDDLKVMNRAHNAMEAKESLSAALGHFDNVTIDLIYGIPTMPNDRWRENLKIAFDFGINHISSYALTVEPKTALASFIKKGKYPPIDEEIALGQFNILVAETENQGFVHYEVSNFGKPNYFSKHNLAYWQGKSYMGIGPSSHSYNGSQRSWNVSNNIKYLKSIQANILPKEVEKLTDKDRFNEYIMTGLRTISGISFIEIEQNFGLEYKDYLLKNSKNFINQGLLEIDSTSYMPKKYCKDKLTATKKGMFLIDGIASNLFMI